MSRGTAVSVNLAKRLCATYVMKSGHASSPLGKLKLQLAVRASPRSALLLLRLSLPSSTYLIAINSLSEGVVM